MLFSHDLMPFSRWPLSENFRFYQNLSFVNEYSKQQHRIQLRQKKKVKKGFMYSRLDKRKIIVHHPILALGLREVFLNASFSEIC